LTAALAAVPALAVDQAPSPEPATVLTAPPTATAGAQPPAAHAQTPTPPHHSACLSKSEQRAAVASKAAMSLGDAIKSLRAHGRRAEVVRARLCRRDEKLVYVLTLLGRSGRVREVNVDALSGELIVGR
jgi:hypothetical protein